MSFKRSEFLGYLYDCILFEYAGRLHQDASANVDMEELAGCFEHIRQMYEDDEDDEQLLGIPSNQYISKQGLNHPEHIKDYILSFDEGCYGYFPYVVDISSALSFNYYNTYNDHITLHGFSGQEVQEFLDNYANGVPRKYHDEIAAIIQGLRDDYWQNRGSGGTWETLPSGMRGATKFCANHNNNKREKKLQRQKEIEDVERRRREREEEEARQEAKRREQEQRRREEQEQKEREQREQRERGAREEAVRQRNSAITKYMNNLQVSLTSSLQRHDEIESLRETLEDELQDYFDDDDIEVHLFGSFASGLSTNTSDADFTVYHLPYGDISELADALKFIGYHSVSHISNARVPITNFYDPENGVNCDANLDEPMGVINSKLIATYRKIDNRFPTLWFAVRQIAKKHDILSGSTGYLSSYALTMMVIVFLQDVTSPAILPRLQQQHTHRMVDCEVDGYDCSFDRNWSNYRTYGSNNPKCAGQLLVDFCQYYGYTLNYANKEVNPCLGKIRSRSVTPPARSQKDRRPKDWPICILDPFITGRNVAGNCQRDAVDEIRLCFQNAFEALRVSNINTAFRR
ncbi:hypothetical protein BGZ95_007752 [Linnemannia exigua]|uniref:polynucleotide adenylyltransferase n=1 Tax=Linnemannia exigua TaxID=604196 RepID=A0AAD4H6Q4_9FUNG|nr:hypothetical protein BGZ95_007752 [Linnemannia exigua]